ncbi:hypothetical protein Nizo2494_0851 [Lactiplantibacillus plantarum]|uniref:DUF2892 domain-containing protein n=2 Tax=Lactiplantibacillus plantarum TaxID=1590 RepID=A0AB34Y2R9_LACPN|nr:predicted protein [Lactiplantibacillus plantarum ST-III]KGH43840.1 hypothetical protein CMPG5300_0706 [Lactiplantibacillus plantarum CMPG5300]KZD97775.1 hypothetical protein FBR5_1135 [Lactiplantibacillus plantarum]KZU05336.1 hypothetical protein Nizo2260_1316 [Lactiplantibacillus plantarum]KZU09316.1 hypothetical protein Nizo2262_0289 [Lactiplantibacillus plantarum]
MDFLKNKRSATAGVASAQQALAADQDKLAKDKKRFHKTIIGFGILAVAALLLQSGASLVITSAAIAIGLFVFKYLHYLSPTNEVIQKDQASLQQELANPVYQQEANGFPEKFYNYWDALRLWKLVNENRARDLQEAFNLLETQHFQEDQLAAQEEIKSLQADIAANAHATAVNSGIAAVSSTISALNSRK